MNTPQHGRIDPKRCLRLKGIAAFAVLALAAASTTAGYITTNESAMDLVYSQASFGSRPIDIRFGSAQTIVSTGLTSIDNDFELNALFSLVDVPSTTVRVFYVDNINYCGFAAGFAGCGQSPGNAFIVNSSLAASSGLGGNLLSHELGHNLGLDHVLPDNGTNLMNPTLFGGPGFLSTAQVATLLTSPLVQTDAFGQRYIQIVPVAVVAVVPELPLWAMFAAGLLLLGGRMRARAQRQNA